MQSGPSNNGRVSFKTSSFLPDPTSCVSRVKIYCAAHAILACSVFVDMGQHDTKAQLDILAKSSQKW